MLYFKRFPFPVQMKPSFKVEYLVCVRCTNFITACKNLPSNQRKLDEECKHLFSVIGICLPSCHIGNESCVNPLLIFTNALHGQKFLDA